MQKALGLRTSHVPNFYGCCCRFWTAILTHGFNRSAGLPYSGLHNTKCWCHIIRFYTKCDPLCAGIRQWTKNLCILNKTAIAVFSSLLASILSICQLQHLDTSPDSKATLYACAKKICMSSLENFGLRTGSCMTFPSFVFSFLKSRKRKRKTEKPDSVLKSEIFQEIQKGWPLCVSVGMTVDQCMYIQINLINSVLSKSLRPHR